MELPTAWIETTFSREENRTIWVIKLDGEVVKLGEVAGDFSGANAYERATAWARQHYPDISFAWKHWSETAPPAE